MKQIRFRGTFKQHLYALVFHRKGETKFPPQSIAGTIDMTAGSVGLGLESNHPWFRLQDCAGKEVEITVREVRRNKKGK
jgi:hypothetical protein